jgi:hypothetical protein
MSLPAVPLISGLMAFSRPERRQLAVLSAVSFFKQTWPNKELILFNSTNRPLLFMPWRGFREIRLRQRAQNQMLNLCAENANGAWLAPWWDDCVYREDYLGTLAEGARVTAGQEILVMLRNKTVFDKSMNSLSTTESEAILCPMFTRSRPVDFALRLVDQFKRVEILRNDPELVTKVARVLHE